MKSRPRPLPTYTLFPHSLTPSHSTLHSTNSNLSAFPLTQQSSRLTSQTAVVTSTSHTESYQRSEILRYNPNIILRSEARGVRWSSKDKTATPLKPEEPKSKEERADVRTREFREIWNENQHQVEGREGWLCSCVNLEHVLGVGGEVR